MDRDSEAVQKSFIRLIEDLGLPAASLADEGSSEVFSDSQDNLHLDDPDPLDSEIFNFVPSGYGLPHSPPPSVGEESSLKSGEVPAVQDRFYSLLKRRLQTEIQRKPPLFPWEKEISDYQPVTAGYAMAETGPSEEPSLVGSDIRIPIWVAQLNQLNLPVPMPQEVLATLLERCQDAVQTSLREGAKLVRAVESLFPGQSQALNQLAGMVMVSPARSGSTAHRSPLQATEDFPSSYDVAIPPQQMVLSLLAAREILGALTLTLSPNQAIVERQWLTHTGMLNLQAKAEYQDDRVRLHVQAELPAGGSVKLRGSQAQTASQRLDAGWIGVELFDLQPNQTYFLELRSGQDEKPLVFALNPLLEG